MRVKYNKEFIKAISDWQSGSKNKLKKADVLKKAIKKANLDSIYKTYNGYCFRKLDLMDKSIYEIATSLSLIEQVSSWTRSLDKAKTFKGGPSHELISCIIRHKPFKEQVVLNLHALYEDLAFVKAVAECSDNTIKGIMKYWNSQEEIILEVDCIEISEVFSLGGHIGTPKQIANIKDEAEFQHLALTIEKITQDLQRSGLKTGDDWWLSPEGAQAVMARTMKKGQEKGIIPSDIKVDFFSSKLSHPILLSL